jgi:DNA modification methylase
MTKVINQKSGKNWQLYHGDCVEVVAGLPDNSVGFSIFSPPFSSLYTYSNSERDMGNSKSDGQFMEQFRFLVQELLRVTKPGREVAFHCCNMPAMKERDGYIGLKPFRDDLTRIFLRAGFIFHSEHCIWKDPLIEATRTKSLGLMHKQLLKDSTRCRAGIPDYLIAMRKPGENPEPVAHENGLQSFLGENPPIHGVMSHEIWRRYASPVWMDINQSNTLQKDSARDEKDERHICPLQLDVIGRALTLWSNPEDIVLSPFAGICSEGFQALKMQRKFIGVELKESYFKQGYLNLQNAEKIQDELL